VGGIEHLYPRINLSFMKITSFKDDLHHYRLVVGPLSLSIGFF
jgi:hypothetical protein